MGQYHHIVNVDKRQHVNPHAFGDGLKLMEFAHSGKGGTMTALALLLAGSNGRGGGDFRGADPDRLVGSWAGDRIAIVGDYCRAGDVPGLSQEEMEALYDDTEDISDRVLALMTGAGKSTRRSLREGA